MKLLIFGGPKFLGRFVIQSALARNHQITLFNRGQTNPDLFPEVEKLRGDRDGDLQPLRGRSWDAVIDTCGFISGHVRASATLLTDAVAHYTFISSVSVYEDFSKSGLDESAPVRQLPADGIQDPTDDNTYGARKALCEQAAEEAMPGRVLNIRAGLIVGPFAQNGRFPYWLRRTALGGEILAPGHPDTQVQLIDVRDLAEWLVKLAESRTVGTFNTTGPAATLTFRQMLEQCAAAAGSNARFTWVPDQFLLDHKLVPFSDLPFWLPESDKGCLSVDCRRAFASGLVCRPLIDTARDTLAWDRAAGSPFQLGLKPERELELLEAWKNSSNAGHCT